MRSALALSLLAVGVLGGCSGGSPAGSYQAPTSPEQRAKLIDKVPLQGDQKQKLMNKFSAPASHP